MARNQARAYGFGDHLTFKEVGTRQYRYYEFPPKSENFIPESKLRKYHYTNFIIDKLGL